MRRSLAALTVGALLLALNPPATASHPTMMCLDIEPDQAWQTTNDDILSSMVAYPGATDAGHPPEHEGCVTENVERGQDWGGTNIDFEITGSPDPDGSDSPTTPDMTCTVPAGRGWCAFPHNASEGGTQMVRAWIDLDGTDATVEADLSEGFDETETPGDTGEPDATDVARWEWGTIDTTSESAITIGYGRRAKVFRGWVTSDYAPCNGQRTVEVFRKRDEKVLIGTTETDDSGRWRLRAQGRARGRFHAVTTPTTRHTSSPGTDVTCSRARSETMRLP